MSVRRHVKFIVAVAVIVLSFGRVFTSVYPSGLASSAADDGGKYISNQDDLETLTWSSSQDGWRGRATLVGPSALPSNLSASDLVVAVTDTGMIGDFVVLAIYTTPDFNSPVKPKSIADIPLADSAEQMPVVSTSDRIQSTESTVSNHIAIDSIGRVWRLAPDDYEALLRLVSLSMAESAEGPDFTVAHIVTCQSTSYLLLPIANVDVDPQDEAERSKLRIVTVTAYSKQQRQLMGTRALEEAWEDAFDYDEEEDEWQKVHELRVPVTGELPAAIYELLGLAQEGMEGLWDGYQDADVLYTVRKTLPRHLLGRMYVHPDL